MSRTRHGSKGCGYDFWGKRALSGICGYGPEVKRITHRIERARAKRAVKEQREMPAREGFS